MIQYYIILGFHRMRYIAPMLWFIWSSRKRRKDPPGYIRPYEGYQYFGVCLMYCKGVLPP